ncbi:MAG: hypothetical protein WCH99_02670 [Verrucomicrobiota bacterium]
MGFLKNISSLFRRRRADVQPLPIGTVTVDCKGDIVTSTVSSAYPNSLLQVIGRDVLELFREARAAEMPLAEVSLHFGSLCITARELRGGAIIFLFPQTALLPTPTIPRL